MQGTWLIGNTLIGIRTNSRECGRWLLHALAEYETSEDAEPYYSLYVPPQGRVVGRRYVILYRESQALFRSLDQSEVAEALLAELDSYLYPERDDALYLRYPLVCMGGVNALVPPDLVPYLATMGGRISDSGLRLPMTLGVAIDLDTCQAVLPNRRLRVNGHQPAPPTEASNPVGIDLVCTTGMNEDWVAPAPRGVVAQTLAVHASNLRALRGKGLETIADMVARARCRELRATSTKQTLLALQLAMSDPT